MPRFSLRPSIRSIEDAVAGGNIVALILRDELGPGGALNHAHGRNPNGCAATIAGAPHDGKPSAARPALHRARAHAKPTSFNRATSGPGLLRAMLSASFPPSIVPIRSARASGRRSTVSVRIRRSASCRRFISQFSPFCARAGRPPPQSVPNAIFMALARRAVPFLTRCAVRLAPGCGALAAGLRCAFEGFHRRTISTLGLNTRSSRRRYRPCSIIGEHEARVDPAAMRMRGRLAASVRGVAIAHLLERHLPRSRRDSLPPPPEADLMTSAR